MTLYLVKEGNKMEIENIKPEDIEARSFEIIGETLGNKKLDPRYELIIKRCIHTSADFEYADSMNQAGSITLKMQIITIHSRFQCRLSIKIWL